MDLHESKDTNAVAATLELPGLTSEGVAIDVHQNRFTISGEPGSSDSQEEWSYIVCECRFGQLYRTLQFPR